MFGEDREATWASVADLEVSVAAVVDAMEADLETLVADIEHRIMPRAQLTKGGSSPPFQDAVRRGVSAGVSDALARLRSQSELPLPEELPPDLIALARFYADSAELRSELDSLAAASLAGQEAYWDHFQIVSERALADPALCWEVLKTVQVRLRGHPARLIELFQRACTHELVRGTDIEDSWLWAVLRM
jgi:hypothetical protein